MNSAKTCWRVFHGNEGSFHVISSKQYLSFNHVIAYRNGQHSIAMNDIFKNYWPCEIIRAQFTIVLSGKVEVFEKLLLM